MAHQIRPYEGAHVGSGGRHVSASRRSGSRCRRAVGRTRWRWGSLGYLLGSGLSARRCAG
ncbi:hypothetical protein STRTUCAR8_10239 [Streptomyces turgidiscabies Car8]|uniref:Uncharacterized protein n=1 Tax=Streptomyces turgidiscabies (strain Car8) TaxID=698760 RepID=L7F2M9_STRT8|nr:hypothetical protein STRTUCAR8_10239 [Streptomyces turgidiscabies Car8]